LHGWLRGKISRVLAGSGCPEDSHGDKLMMRNEDIMKLLILKQGSLNFAEKPVMLCSFGKSKLTKNLYLSSS
jgi:hypothetical protein